MNDVAATSLRINYLTNEVDRESWLYNDAAIMMYVNYLKCPSRLFKALIQKLCTEFVDLWGCFNGREDMLMRELLENRKGRQFLQNN